MMPAAPTRRRTAIIIWLLALIASGIVIARTTFTADLSAFLPQTPTKEQQVLLDQLQHGVVSRMILIGIEGADAPARAALSKDIAAQLRASNAFTSINNGEPVNARQDQAFLFNNRYLLSPGVTPERFTPTGMQAAISDTIELLASPAGMLIKPLLPRDPTGEFMQLLDQISGANQPRSLHGAWASKDGARALLLAQTAANGADTDAQQHAMQQIRQAFDGALARQRDNTAQAALVMTGPGVFSVQARDTIETEVTRLSIISTLIIVTLLYAVYRSFSALLLGLLPVVSGALAGVVAVSLGFGTVHGITLGFGITLIGEAVDYSIYLFVQSRQSAADAGRVTPEWVERFWPTIRLGVMTSIVGFASLLLSSFPGLAQLGLFSISGLVAAAVVTRFVLPYLLPKNFQIRDVSHIGHRLTGLAMRAPLLRWPAVVVILLACVVLLQHRAHLWNTELASLSPVAQEDQMIDARLRADMGAPDVRYMVVVSGSSSDAVLASAEKIAAQLQPLVEQGVLAGFETPSRYLPSIATQRARQASLPIGDMQQRLQQATAALPLRADKLALFIDDVSTASKRAPLQRADLNNTSLALAVDSLMFQRGQQWNALLPLTAPAAGARASSIDTAPVRAALAAAGEPTALFVDLKAESDQLYSGYLREAILLSLAGLAAITLLLLMSLRSLAKVARILLPLLAAVVVVAALLALTGHRMTILHLVGLLLIAAVGSNYALFFNQPTAHDTANGTAGISPQTLTSLVFANMTTVAAFGLLGFAQVPVLQAIGMTVGPGALLALGFAAIFADRAPVVMRKE